MVDRVVFFWQLAARRGADGSPKRATGLLPVIPTGSILAFGAKSPTSRLTDDEDLHGRIRRHRRDTVQSPLETYLREINETDLLSADEEKMLARRIADGDRSARDWMVKANLRLVVKHRPELRRQGTGAPGSDRGGESRPPPRGGRVRPERRDPVQHLCQLLDQAVDQAGLGEHRQADPHPRLYG